MNFNKVKETAMLNENLDDNELNDLKLLIHSLNYLKVNIVVVI